MSPSVSQSVFIFWDYFTNATVDFDRFLRAAFSYISFWLENYEVVFEAARGGGVGLGRTLFQSIHYFYLPFYFAEVRNNVFYCYCKVIRQCPI